MVDPEHPGWKVPAKLRTNARTLRRNSTDAERILWLELRGNRLNGASFRRQVPIERYIADFICHAAKLVIELDGGQHFSEDGERADARRSAAIEAKGFKVLRFSNLDIMTNRAGVLETIATTVAESAPTRSRCSASASILEAAAVGRLCLPRKREREQTVSVEKKQP
ncbi:endonuclease domain-containing protein [Bradyrhizobium sp. WSM3983]|uniref:endonuclease domain-containing protein n=1 Tax=Bradyrhizobium sp. WSM3983 TaxID=1038867 RepID=UPI0009FE8F33|nr:DUF559 domain-containing protein [Bradyrhizobium sp. WSM3983]